MIPSDRLDGAGRTRGGEKGHRGGSGSGAGAGRGGPEIYPPTLPPLPTSAATSRVRKDEKKGGGHGVNVAGTTWRIDPARRRPRTERAARVAEMERWKAGDDGRGGTGGGEGATHGVGYTGREGGFEDEDREGWRSSSPAREARGPPQPQMQSQPQPRFEMRATSPSEQWAQKMRGTAAASLLNERRSEDGSRAATSSASSAPVAPSAYGGSCAGSAAPSGYAPTDRACLYPSPGSHYSEGHGPPPGGPGSEVSHLSSHAGSCTASHTASHTATGASQSEYTGSAASTWVNPGSGGGDASHAAIVDGLHATGPVPAGDGGASGGGMGLGLPGYVPPHRRNPSGGSGVSGAASGMSGAGHPSPSVYAGVSVNGQSAAGPMLTPGQGAPGQQPSNAAALEMQAEVTPVSDGGGPSKSATAKKWHQKTRNRIWILLAALVVAAGGITAGVLLSGGGGGGATTTSTGTTTPPVEETGGGGTTTTATTTAAAPTETYDPTPPTDAQMAAAERDLTALICASFPPSCPSLEEDPASSAGGAPSTQRRAVSWLASHPPAYLAEKYASDYAKLARYSLVVLYLSTTFQLKDRDDEEEEAGGGAAATAGEREGWMVYRKDVCEWEGVECNSENVVERLEMGGFLEEGTVPAELAVLGDGLEELYLRKNGLEGELPTHLGLLSKLEVLSVSENKLSGKIPVELGELRKLQTLYLQLNQFDGSVPAEVCGLTSVGKLQYLWADCLRELQCGCCSHCCDLERCCRTGGSDQGVDCTFFSV